MTKRLVGIAMLFGLLAGCGGGGGPTDPAPQTPGPSDPAPMQPGNVVQMLASVFNPSTLTVARGTEVIWNNAQAVAHTITPQGHTVWNKVDVAATTGEKLRVTFTTAGTFAYECELHAGMTGSIVVQ